MTEPGRQRSRSPARKNRAWSRSSTSCPWPGRRSSVHSVAEEAGAGRAGPGCQGAADPGHSTGGSPAPPGTGLGAQRSGRGSGSAGGAGMQAESGRRAQEFEDGLQAALPGQQRLIQDNSITAPCHEAGAAWGRLGAPGQGWGGPVTPSSAGTPSGRVLYPHWHHRQVPKAWGPPAGRC